MAEGAPGNPLGSALEAFVRSRREETLKTKGIVLLPRNMFALAEEIDKEMKRRGKPFREAFDEVFTNPNRWQKEKVPEEKLAEYAEFAHEYFRKSSETTNPEDSFTEDQKNLFP